MAKKSRKGRKINNKKMIKTDNNIEVFQYRYLFFITILLLKNRKKEVKQSISFLLESHYVLILKFQTLQVLQ